MHKKNISLNGNTDLIANIDNLMEYEVLVQKDIIEVKAILSLQIQQAYKLKETLNSRCSKLKEMLDIYMNQILS